VQSEKITTSQTSQIANTDRNERKLRFFPYKFNRIPHLLCTFSHRELPETHYVPYLTFDSVLIRQCQTTTQKNCHCHTPYAYSNSYACSTPAPLLSNVLHLYCPLRLRRSTLRLRKSPIASFLWINCDYALPRYDYASLQMRGAFFESIATMPFHATTTQVSNCEELSLNQLRLRPSTTLRLRKSPIASFLWINCDYALPPRYDYYASLQLRAFFESIATMPFHATTTQVSNCELSLNQLQLRPSTLRLRKSPNARSFLWINCDYALPPRYDYASLQLRAFFESIATTPFHATTMQVYFNEHYCLVW
jgi:hypothetical protein